MNWFAGELHTHTVHSDGEFTVEQLCRAAKERELSLIALTDHNTASGLRFLTKALEEETVPVIRGIEWTTFFGHMLVLGCGKHVDWRYVRPPEIDDRIRKIHENGGIVGMAHPFSIGSPMYTGCSWEFQIRDYSLVDYIEVWSGTFPPVDSAENIRSIHFWSGLLDKGHRIAISYGRDWHHNKNDNEPQAATMLGIDGERITPELAMDAIRRGRTMITLGPVLDARVAAEGRQYVPGDVLPRGAHAVFTVRADAETRRKVWGRFDIRCKTLRVVGEGERILWEGALGDGETAGFELPLDQQWFRFELWGACMGKSCPLCYSGAYYTE